MRKFVCVFFLVIVALVHAVGQKPDFYAVNLTESKGTGLIHGIPVWAIQGDTTLFWVKDKMLSTSEIKNNTIRSLFQTDPVISALDTVFEIPLDTIAQMSFMHDINRDGKQDFILYGILPFCDFQPYIYILLNQDTAFQDIFHQEGCFVGWRETNNFTNFQILVSGCCEDRHGYLYDFSCTKSDQTHSVFWQSNATHPSAITMETTITIKQNSTILLPAAGYSNRYQNDVSHQFNWMFFKGDTGKVLSETTVDGQTWYYVQMPVKPHNALQYFKDASYIYGWILHQED